MIIDADIDKKVIDHYQKGQGSIQDIARVYRLSVDQVLRILKMDDLTTVVMQGDMIDQAEAGQVPVVHAHEVKTEFTTD